MIRVSILLCVYNAENYIIECLESLERQSFKEFEVVLVNDGSTDNTSHIILDFIKVGNLIIKYYEQENRGLTVSLNRAIGLAEGEYFARMDADDIAHPERLERSYEFITENNLDFMCTRSMRFDSRGDIGLFPSQNFSADDKALSPRLMKFGNMFAHGTFFAKREVFKKLGYDERFRTAQDYDFLCRLVKDKNFKQGYCNEVLYQLRVDDNSSGRKTSSSQLENAKQICKEHFGTSFYLIPAANNIFKKYILSLVKRIIS